MLWYSSLVLVAVLGVGLTTFSRDQRLDELGSPTSKEPPQASKDHWHVAMGVRVCDRWLDPPGDQTDPKGIHGHGDGVIHVHPFVASAAGKRATLDRYAEALKAKVSVDSFTWPVASANKKETHKNGGKCGDQEAEVKAFYNGEVHDGDPGLIPLTDRGKLVLAFVPKDTTYEQIGDPPSTGGLDNLTDVEKPAAEGEGQSQQVDPTVTTAPAGTETPPVSEAPPTSASPPTSATG